METRYQVDLMVAMMFFGTVILIALGYFWSKRPRGVDNKQLTEIATRLASLERAVDAIAVETERISEGQRFTTKLLSDKAPARSVGQ